MIAKIIAAAQDAGQAIERVRAPDMEVHEKGDSGGPRTRADRDSDALLRTRLTALVPAGWLSEETSDTRERLVASRLWIVDPLDGTKEFVAGLPEYCVAIALIDAGEPTLAVVHNPRTGDVFWAERGRGAFRNSEPIWVREGDTLLASRTEVGAGEFEPFAADWTVRTVGSIQLKLALVAAGDASATLSRGPKWEWDVSAGALLVAEAGGRVTDVTGAPLRYNQPWPKTRGVLAGAPGAYDRALARINAIGVSARMGELNREARLGDAGQRLRSGVASDPAKSTR